MRVRGALLFRWLRKEVQAFDTESLPLSGVVGRPGPPALGPVHTLKQTFRKTPGDLGPAETDSLWAIKQLRKQREALQQAEPETRQALAAWHALQKAHSWAGSNPLAAAAAIEEGALLVHRLAEPPADFLLDEDDQREHEERVQAETEQARQSLDELALQVQQSSGPDLFAPASAAAEGAEQLSAVRQEQLQHISRVLFKEQSLKQEPYEWVYDGLRPLLLPHVLRNRSGLYLSQAVVFMAVAARLRVPVAMVREPTPDPLAALSGGGNDLPEHVAARHALRTVATAPEPDCWVIQASGCEDTVIVDLRKAGHLLTGAAAKEAYPNVEWVQNTGSSPIIQVWAEYARVMVTAHQRRGESDAVAHWIFQLMALDPMAQEWSHALPTV